MAAKDSKRKIMHDEESGQRLHSPFKTYYP